MYIFSSDFVYHEGDIGREVYFLIQGKLQVVGKIDTPSEEIYNELEDGSTFGELALFKEHKRKATIRAIKDSQLYVLPVLEAQKHTELFEILKEKMNQSIGNKFTYTEL